MASAPAAVATIASVCAAAVAQTASAPPLTVNAASAHVAAVQRDNRVFVPAQSIFSQVGATVVYNAPRAVIRTTRGKVVAAMALGNHAATVNGSVTTLPVAPFMRDGQLMVPLRLIGEAAGATVSYSAHPRGVNVSRPAAAAATSSSAGTAATAGPASNAGAGSAGGAQANSTAATVAQANAAPQAPDAAAATPAATSGGIPWWVWLLAALIVAAIVFALLRRKKEPVIVTRGSVERTGPIARASARTGADEPSITTRSESR